MHQQCPPPATNTNGNPSRSAIVSLSHNSKHIPFSSWVIPQSSVDPKFFPPSGLISILCLCCVSFSFSPRCSCFPTFCYSNSVPSFIACPLFHYFVKPFLIVMLRYSLLLSLIVFDPPGSGLLVCCLLDSLSLFIDVQLTLQNEHGAAWLFRMGHTRLNISVRRGFFNCNFYVSFLLLPEYQRSRNQTEK